MGDRDRWKYSEVKDYELRKESKNKHEKEKERGRG